MDVGIIGGHGGMGSLFAGVFERAGHRVTSTGRSTRALNRELASSCDIVMVSVPIRETVAVIRDIAPDMGPDQILCDLTSLKEEPVKAMCESDAVVVGLHPMFGPTIPSLRGQTIVATPARCDPQTEEEFLDIFRREGANITITTPAGHDRMMAVIQGLIHTVTLCLAETIRHSGIPVEETLTFTSPIYRIQLSLIGRLLSQDPTLYADLITGNPHTPGVLATFGKVAAEIGSLVEREDADAFVRKLATNRKIYGDFVDEAARETDLLIDAMVRR
ncbi:MAG: prephenate dehydrogenase/arogenate dehydrogenase family protein [Methanomicrobiales archaeon]